jgi:hypothetical protein
VVVAETAADAKALVQNVASKVVFGNVTPVAPAAASNMAGWSLRVAIYGTDGSVLTDQIVTNSGQSEAVASASGVLTSSANYSDTDTVTIGSRVYTFQSSLTAVDGHVKIGTTEAASITNLANAVNGSGGVPGTDYSVTAADPNVTAVGAAHTLTVTAKVAGSAPNAVVTTETSATAAWGAATLAGGVTVLNTVASLAALMASALNGASVGITHAAFNNSTHTLTVASVADALGDRTVVAEVYPPVASVISPTGVTTLRGVPIPGFVGTVTSGGVSAAALTAVLAADTYGVPNVSVKARVQE